MLDPFAQAMASVRGPAGNPPGMLGTLGGDPAGPPMPPGMQGMMGMASPYDAILRQFGSFGFYPAAGGSSTLNPSGMVRDPIMADQLAMAMPPSESAMRLDPGLLDPAGPMSQPPGGAGAGMSLAQQLQTGTPAGVGSLPDMLAQAQPQGGPQGPGPSLGGPPPLGPPMGPAMPAPGGGGPPMGGPPGLASLQALLAQARPKPNQLPAANSPLLNALGGGR